MEHSFPSRENTITDSSTLGGAFDHADIFGPHNLRQLWFLFIVVTTRTNPSNPEVMRKRDLVSLMRQCELVKPSNQKHKKPTKPNLKPENNPHNLVFCLLMEAEINVIHQAEENRYTPKRYSWSAFLRSLITIATKAYRENPESAAHHKKAKEMNQSYFLRDEDEYAAANKRKANVLAAVGLLLENHLIPRTERLVKSFLNEKGRGLLPVIGKNLMSSDCSIVDEIENEELVGLISVFTPCLKEIFQYFATVPSHSELVKGRHPIRRDISHVHQVFHSSPFLYIYK
jgi:hypothetical protein